MSNKNEVDVEKQFLADIEKAMALSMESRALEEFRRKKVNYSNSDLTANRKPNAHNITPQDYEKILKLRQEAVSQQSRNSISNKSTVIAPPPSSGVSSHTNSSTSRDKAAENVADLISFTSPTSSKDESHSNFMQMCDDIHKSLRSQSVDSATMPLNKSTSQNYMMNVASAFNQLNLQVVPYATPESVSAVRAPLTPDQLNKLYNMNPQPRIGYGGIPRPILTPPPYQTMYDRTSTPLPLQSFMPPVPLRQHNNFYLRNTVSEKELENRNFTSESPYCRTNSSSHSVPNMQSLQRHCSPSSFTPGKTILTPIVQSNSIQNISVTPAPSTSSDISYRKNADTQRLGDDLIDLRHGSEEHNRVSVLEAFDPLLLQNEDDDKDDVSSEYYYECDPFDYLYSGGTQYSDPVYEAVSKTEKTPLSPPSGDASSKWNEIQAISRGPEPILPPRKINNEVNTLSGRRSNRLYENVVINKSYDSELVSFYEMVVNIRFKYKYDDVLSNVGHIVASEFPNHCPENTSIKLVVYPALECLVPRSNNINQTFNNRTSTIEGCALNNEKGQYEGYGPPVTFTCDISTTVEHVIMHVSVVLEGQIIGNVNDFMLKPIGMIEWLRSSSKLNQLECVHNSIKLEQDVQFGLCPKTAENLRSIGRTQQDDIRDAEIKIEDVIVHEPNTTINYDSIMILLETLETEIDRLISSAPDASSHSGLSCSGVTQAIKAICSMLGYIETLEISETTNDLKAICATRSSSIYTEYGSMMDVVSENGDYAEVALRPRTFCEQIKYHCNKVRYAIEQLLDVYSNASRVDFCVKIPDLNTNTKSLASIIQPVIVHISCLHRLPPAWKFDDYLLGTQIYHGTRYIGDAMVTQCTIENIGSYPRLKFKSWLNFENIPVCTLPREARLIFVLYGCKTEPADGGTEKEKDNTNMADGEKQQIKIELGWFAIQFFTFESTMIHGSYLLSMWPPTTVKYLGPAPAKGTHPHSNDYPILGIEIPDYGGTIVFPETPANVPPSPKLDFNSLDPNLQHELIDTAEQGYPSAVDKREVLWEKRYYLHNIPHALPKILYAAHSWDFASLVDLHALIKSWRRLSPLQALELLLPRYPDMEVRAYAVRCLSEFTNDQFSDYLPQLVQALKHDTYEASPMAKLLLSRSLESPRIAHHLYWLLVHCLPGECPQNSSIESSADETLITQSRYHRRNQMLLRALLATCGEKLSTRFLSQNMMCRMLGEVAQIVKQTKESHRQKVLVHQLDAVHHHLLDRPTSLPLGPGLEVRGIIGRSSSYFNSNTLPLKINFMGPDSQIVPAIFKSGDDLQQDMLTLQIVQLMDKLWLKEGLDLKMVTFKCVPTGHKKGMIELVSHAETLRKIQVEWGLTGSFKDKPIAEWLARKNPSQLEYQRAVKNFTASCAGYSVATYILGICDRHNDNIMLKESGHLFHIDFGKFLGDVQMFGNFKRDRTPFVLTSDMAYVINGGDKPSTEFHHFVDLSCQAFNIVRKHGDLILHMLALMATSGIPGVTADSVNYVRKALLPGQSNPEAAASFAKMIHISLKSWFTQFNFFLHNLAQLRFTSDEGNGELLSFVPRVYTMAQDGRLESVNVHSYQKRYDLEKYYTYILKVTRQNQPDPAYLFRSYKEFLEFHQKLCLHYPLAKLHSLPSGLHVGRSHIKTVAERRLPEIKKFLVSLFNSADEIAHSDLVYTFFHPLLRDQQEADIHVKKVKEIKNTNPNERVSGQLKFSLQYHRGALTVMIHHARSLPLTSSGQEPNTYVKCYLKPDVLKATKRKTKVVRKSCYPSFMETLEYRMPIETIQHRNLEVTIWSHDSLQENEFLGGVQLSLKSMNLREEILQWYTLSYVPRS